MSNNPFDDKDENQQLLLDLNQLNQLNIFPEGDNVSQNHDLSDPPHQHQGNLPLLGEVDEHSTTANHHIGSAQNLDANQDIFTNSINSARELSLNVLSARRQQHVNVEPSNVVNPFAEDSPGYDNNYNNLVMNELSDLNLDTPNNPFYSPSFGSLNDFPMPNESLGKRSENIDSDSDDSSTSSQDSDDLFNVNAMLKSRRNVSSSLTPFMSKLLNKVDIKNQEEYDIFTEENLKKDVELNMEAIIIKDVEEDKIEREFIENKTLQVKLQTQHLMELEAIDTLEDLRNLERYTRENVAINKVMRLQSMFNQEEYKRDRLRRRAYKELSDSARHYFKKKEDLIKLKLERRKAYMVPSQDHIQVHKKQWALDWDKEPKLLDLRVCQIRGIGNALPEGKYTLLMSIWNRIGGYPLQFSKHLSKVKKSTREIYHTGQFDDVSMIFDEVIRLHGPSVSQITPRIILSFELLWLSRGTGGQHIYVNKTVAWGVFPVVDNNLKLIQGCFKCPLIKGDVDYSIDKYEQVQRIVKKKPKYWLGNLYFEVRHSGVDPAIRSPEEYVLEVKHADKDEENDILAQQNLIKKPLKYKSLYTKIKDIVSNPENVKEASEFFKSTNKKKQVLTMEQQKVWFGDPEFSVLRPKEVESDSDTETVQTEEADLSSVIEDENDAQGDDEKIENLKAPLLDAARTENQSLSQPNHNSSSFFSSFRIPSSGKGIASMTRKVFSTAQSSRRLISSPGPSGISLHSSQSQRSLKSHQSQISVGNQAEETNSDAEDTNVQLFGKDDGLLLFSNMDDSPNHSPRESSKPNTAQQQPQNAESSYQLNQLENNEQKTVDQGQDSAFDATFLKRIETQAVKTLRDVQLVTSSLFKDIFELSGATRMDLNFYKQSVWRKKHTWGGTPIYWEKLVYLRRSILIDLGIHNFRTIEFYLMWLFILLVLILRAYPHYLGHWIYLSFLRIPIVNSDPSNFYHIAFSFRGEFRTTAVNFGYAVSGLLFNIFLSCAMFVFARFSQVLFTQLPILVYRFIFIFGVLVLLDPFLIGMIGAAFQDWDTDMFRLATYFLVTERSTVPGVLITIALYVPLLIIQCVCLYQYTLRIHMNRRILDVYKRLHTREKDTYLPHDLEITYKKFKRICEESKKWRGPDGHTRFITISRIPVDMTDSILLRRLDVLLMSKKWPSDYIKEVIDMERDMYGEEITHIPVEILASKSRPAVFLKQNHFGKVFSIINFPALVDAILFDKYRIKEKKWRLLRIERLLVDYKIIDRGLIQRLRDGKFITGHIMSPHLGRADYEIFSLRDVEVSIPEKVPKSGVKGFARKIGKGLKIASQFVYNRVSKTVFKNEDDMLTYDDIHENELLDERRRKIPYTDKICMHVQIYNQSLTRERTLYRHFIRCPSGSICEVFEKSENQETSAIADTSSNDYWIRRARLEAEWRAKSRARLAQMETIADTNPYDF